MKTRYLQLDFLAGRRPSFWAACILALIALGFTADIGLSYGRLKGEVSEKEEQLAALTAARPVAGRAAPPADYSKEEIAFARETIERIAMPWNRLFMALEAAANPKVVLLSIEPDAKTGSLLITGESETYLEALQYMQALRQSGVLKGVHMVKHEVQAAQEQRVSFSVSATWSRT
jgi:hypothetical protein